MWIRTTDVGKEGHTDRQIGEATLRYRLKVARTTCTGLPWAGHSCLSVVGVLAERGKGCCDLCTSAKHLPILLLIRLYPENPTGVDASINIHRDPGMGATSRI